MGINFTEGMDGPAVEWVEPAKLPDLSEAKQIAIDTETVDLSIKRKLGAGGCKGMGELLGISVATDTGYSGWLPLTHWSIEELRAWARDQLCNAGQQHIYANCLYDLEWMHTYGIPYTFNGLSDVQILEPLIDSEKRKFNLASLAKKYLSPKWQKSDEQMHRSAEQYLNKKIKNVYDHLQLLPPSILGPYAEMDAIVTLMVYQAQLPIIKSQGLETVMNLEHRQIPLILKMRTNGVRINKRRLNKVHDTMLQKLEENQNKLDKTAGFPVNVAANASLAALWEDTGLPIVETEKGNPSFTESVLKDIDSPIAEMVLAVRKCSSALKFTKSIYDHLHKGRIHGEFHPLRSDEYGTVSGRYSSSHPNLQNQPGKKNPEMGALLRSCYVPEVGMTWGTADYSQIEYKLIVDYAARIGLPGAMDALNAYRDYPDTDFHEWVCQLTGLSRPSAKQINFGLAYNMGKTKLGESLGLGVEEASAMFDLYHNEVPFVVELMRRVSRKASKIGYIKTLSGRRRRFDMWEDGTFGAYNTMPLPKDEAIKAYGKVRRAFTYKAGNALIQGAAADIMKEGMAAAYEDGVFDYLTPHITVHDEMNVSIPNNPDGKEAFAYMIKCMVDVYKEVIAVPLTMEKATGKDWWNVKEF